MNLGDEATIQARRIAEQLLALDAERPPGEPPAMPPPGAGEPPGPPLPPLPPLIDYPRLQHHLRWFDRVLALYRAAALAVADQVVLDDPGDGVVDEDDRLMGFVRRAHRILLEHPVAAKLGYAALASEGRAYAATFEGAALRDRLLRSPRVRHASLVWRALTMGMLDEDDPGELPSTYLDNLLRAVDREDLERLLGRLYLREVSP
jgi:hypothetical protein